MTLSQKCLYAVRAIFELARQYGEGATRLQQIAEVQAIPSQFLELILRQHRQGGFVKSKRGIHGGYLLAMQPAELSIGEIIAFIDGEMSPVRCITDEKTPECPLYGDCAFMNLWTRARDAIEEIYGETSFQDLVDEQIELDQAKINNYSI